VKVFTLPTEAFPLSWPTGVPRSKFPRRAKFGDQTVASQLDEIDRQLRLMGAAASVISSNLPTRKDGRPRGDGLLRFNDQGVCVYWTAWVTRGGKSLCAPHAMPCDKWDRIEHNLRAIAMSLDAMRGLERWGAVTIEQAFAGFVALPPGDPDAPPAAPAERTWREVLDVPIDGWVTSAPPAAVLAYARTRHRELIKLHHPDRGGDPAVAAAINRALDLAEAELGA
jgi:hypothetical protein